MSFFGPLYIEEPAIPGRPLLLLHGLGANSYSWRHLIPELPPSYAPYQIDLKGFGQAKKPDDGRYSLHDQADLIFKLIVERDLSPVSLVGHSMGGGVVLMTALRLIDAGRPLDRLVLIDPVCYPLPWPKLLVILLLNVLAPTAVALSRPRLLVRLALKAAYFDPNKITPDMIEAYAAPLHETDARDALRNAVRQIFPPDLGEKSGRYPEITAPTLLVWGWQDRVIRIRCEKRLAAALPNATPHIIETCGHIPHEETPEQAVPAIVDFLDKPTPASSVGD